MKLNEIKETKEVVVRTEYIAEDGTVFRSEEECRKYEESALFVAKSKVKLISKCYQDAINDDFCCDNPLEIYDIQTQEDLDNLKKYLWLRLSQHTKEENFKGCFEDDTETKSRGDYVFSNVTYGHEVMIFWTYEEDWFWVYKDGSINGYLEFTKNRINKLLTPKTETK